MTPDLTWLKAEIAAAQQRTEDSARRLAVLDEYQQHARNVAVLEWLKQQAEQAKKGEG